MIKEFALRSLKSRVSPQYGNLFAYAGNNPIKYTDPDGRVLACLTGLVVGGIGGGLSALAQGKRLNSREFWAGVAGGATSGLIAGAAVDLTVLTGGTALPFILVFAGGALGGAVGSALKTKSGRIIVPLYTLKNTACIYSDDNGETWQRNKRFPYTDNIDEWSAVQAEDGSIYSFGRAKSLGKTPVSVSKDNGITWVKDKKADFKAPKCQKNAICIGDKIYVSHPSGKIREKGVISIGEFVYDKKGNVKGIKWSKDDIRINDGFFAYSCLTKLDDNTLGILYADAPSAHIVFEKIKLN